jgi:hypothetical protein
VKPSLSKGLGVFALKNFEPGDLIFAEESLLPVAPNDSWLMKETAFKLATPERQQRFMALHSQCNCGTQTCHETEFQRRWAVNSLETNVTAKGNQLFEIASRINHACTPNCTQKFMSQRQSGLPRLVVIKAAKPIKKGEEITIDYMNYFDKTLSKQARRKYLMQKYKFLCRCRGCTIQPSQDMVAKVNSQHQPDSGPPIQLGDNQAESGVVNFPEGFEIINARGSHEYGAEQKMGLCMNTMLEVLQHLPEMIKMNIYTEFKKFDWDEDIPDMCLVMYRKIVEIIFRVWETTLRRCNVFELDEDVITQYIQRILWKLKWKVNDEFGLRILIKSRTVGLVGFILETIGKSFKM